jgi:hypothetical protein
MAAEEEKVNGTHLRITGDGDRSSSWINTDTSSSLTFDRQGLIIDVTSHLFEDIR